MKAKIVLFTLIVWGSSARLLQGQIRSDFVLVPEGVSPQIAFDTQGRLHATWAGEGIYYGVFDSVGNVFTTKREISAESFTRTPRLALSENYLVVTWTGFYPGAFSSIAGSLIDHVNGHVVGRIGYFPTQFSANSDVRYLDDSRFITVWSGRGAAPNFLEHGVYGQIVANSLQTTGDTLLFTDDISQQYRQYSTTRIAKRQGDGNTVVTWLACDSLLIWSVLGRRLTKAGVLLDSTFLVSENSNYSNACGLSTIMNPDEGYTATWTVRVGDSIWNVYRRQFDVTGLPLGPSQPINEQSISPFADVEMAGDADGTQIVVWSEQRNGKAKIVAQRFASNGTPVGTNFLVSVQQDTFDQGTPSVTLRNGKIYTAWSVPDTIPGKGTIWANILDFNNPQVGVEPPPDNAPQSFHLYQNYPNPFNAATTIKYEVPRRSHVRLVIHNVLGEEIIKLTDKEMILGSYAQQWDGKDKNGIHVPSGIYLYQLVIEEYRLRKKMILFR